ncbi:MAG: caspase family protein [Spirochaetales bacterium]|nr:caspase family protein [Spirochaetales bacterium]
MSCKKRVLYVILLIFVILPLYGMEKNDKAVRPAEEITEKNNEPLQWEQSLNTIKTFKNVIPQNTYVFMVGNNKYTPASGMGELSQCYNDLLVMKGIFINCLKIDEDKIFSYKDLTLDDFRKLFLEAILTISKDTGSRVIFYYSGHGQSDGSLVFTDGSVLSPTELRYHINSFENDTILIIDACYSGNNEGPKEIKNTLAYKKNCWRIYAALAHQTAREDIYKDEFFKTIMPLYKDVLHIESIEGNSFFVALCGIFFTKYAFKPQENISFRELVYFISGAGKKYVEYLAAKGERDGSSAIKIRNRTNQLPIIYPVNESVDFKIKNHKYLIFQNDESEYWPVGDFYSVELNVMTPIPLGILADSLSVGIHPGAAFTFNKHIKESIFGFGFVTGLNYMPTQPEAQYPGGLLCSPVALHLIYRTAFPILFFFQCDCDIGALFIQPVYSSDVTQRTSALGTLLYGALSIHIGVHVTRFLTISAAGRYSVLFDQDNVSTFIQPGLSVSFQF